MICPVVVASEMSALAGGEDKFHAKRHGKLSEGRSGAGDDGPGSDFAGDGEEDQLEPLASLMDRSG